MLLAKTERRTLMMRALHNLCPILVVSLSLELERLDLFFSKLVTIVSYQFLYGLVYIFMSFNPQSQNIEPRRRLRGFITIVLKMKCSFDVNRIYDLLLYEAFDELDHKWSYPFGSSFLVRKKYFLTRTQFYLHSVLSKTKSSLACIKLRFRCFFVSLICGHFRP